MRYPGGKNGSGTFQKIINLIPVHQVYIEPFLGSGAIMRLKLPAMHSVGIDRSADVISGLQWLKSVMPVTLLCTDALSWLASVEVAADTFIYCDPPYVMSTRSDKLLYGDFELSDKQHELLLDILLSLNCMVAISGYDNALYREKLASWRTYEFQAVTRGGTMRTETVWMNYPEPEELHDYRYLGEDRRERERIKRKKDRWVKRLLRMKPFERHVLMQAINSLVPVDLSSMAGMDTRPTYVQEALWTE